MDAIDGIVNESLGVQDVPSRQHDNIRSKPNFQSAEEVCSIYIQKPSKNQSFRYLIGSMENMGILWMTSIQELESPKLGMSGRANKEIELKLRKKKIEEIAMTTKKLLNFYNGSPEMFDTIKKLSSLLVEEYTQHCKTNSSESISCSSETDTHGLDQYCLGLSSYLTKDQIEDLEQAFNLIFASDVNREIFFQPMQDMGIFVDPVSHAFSKLAHVFEEKFVEIDRLIASVLVLFSGVIDCDTIMKNLNETNFFPYKYLLRLEELNNPNLTPIKHEQIDDQNMNECAHFLSSYTELSTLDLLRYLVHMAKHDTKYAVHLLQSHVLEIPPHCLLYLTFSYYEALIDATSTTITGKFTMCYRCKIEVIEFERFPFFLLNSNFH